MAGRLLISAGDPSGDHHGALLVAELRRRRPELTLLGCGGPQLAAAGVELVGNLVQHSAIGLADVLPAVLPAHRLLRELTAVVRRDPPDAAVLIDCGAFNLPLARVLRELGVPVLGFFPPGSWSGSRRRAVKVAAAYTAVATPFPQPLAVYAELGLPAELVGHPLVDELAPLAAARAALPLEPPVLGLLPGSRRQEIRHILPLQLATAAALRQANPALRVLVSRAPGAAGSLFDRQLAGYGGPLEVVEGTREVLARATAILAKSGTVTLEALLVGAPLVVCYRVSHLAYALASIYYWPRPRFFSLPNILADRRIVPEWFQYHARPARLAAELEPLLRESERRREMLADLAATAARLGGGGAIARTATLVERLLDAPPTAR